MNLILAQQIAPLEWVCAKEYEELLAFPAVTQWLVPITTSSSGFRHLHRNSSSSSYFHRELAFHLYLNFPCRTMFCVGWPFVFVHWYRTNKIAACWKSAYSARLNDGCLSLFLFFLPILSFAIHGKDHFSFSFVPVELLVCLPLALTLSMFKSIDVAVTSPPY